MQTLQIQRPRKPVRSVAGVAVVAVMTSPERCPHGRCVYCPGGVDSEFHSPQSYTGHEPAARRGKRNDYDGHRQVSERLQVLRNNGHPLDKIDLVVMGGTFTSRPPDYQEGFIRGCLDAMNGVPSGGLEDAQGKNETAAVRCVGMTLETRPDWAQEPHVPGMLRLGATKVELGVQHLDNPILEAAGRRHTIEDSARANGALRDAGLKVGFHMMLGLPGSTPARDAGMCREIFEDPRFMPDYLKLYPTLVVRDTPLHEMWRRGEYTPLESEEAARAIADIKSRLPPWVRLMRIQRDIPAPFIEAGPRHGNLREMAWEVMRAQGRVCRCIRCREVGQAMLRGEPLEMEEPGLVERTYTACGGWEHFLSFETPRGWLVGFLRLRFPPEGGSTSPLPLLPVEKTTSAFTEGQRHYVPLPNRSPGLEDSALLRELHIYGPQVPLGGESPGFAGWRTGFQHRGYGARLVERAVELSREAGFDHLATMSGVGARPYYARLGFVRRGPYMVRDLGAM